jgi:hypothetical protein
MDDVGIFYGHLLYFDAICCICGYLVHFMVIWYIFPVLVCCTEKNLAALLNWLSGAKLAYENGTKIKY